jgi:hypothetical protein
MIRERRVCLGLVRLAMNSVDVFVIVWFIDGPKWTRSCMCIKGTVLKTREDRKMSPKGDHNKLV